MNEDRVVGMAKNVGGKAQEGLGRVAGDAKMQADGLVNQIQGAAQDLYGQARDGAAQLADAASESAANARRTASSFESSLRNTIETQPYTAILLAVALGWLIGRTHRPV